MYRLINPRLSTADQRVKFYQALAQNQLSQRAWERDLVPAADKGDTEDHTRCYLCTDTASGATHCRFLPVNCFTTAFPSHPRAIIHNVQK